MRVTILRSKLVTWRGSCCGSRANLPKKNRLTGGRFGGILYQ